MKIVVFKFNSVFVLNILMQSHNELYWLCFARVFEFN